VVRQKLFRIPFPDSCCCFDFSFSFFANYSNQKLDKKKKGVEKPTKTSINIFATFLQKIESILVTNQHQLVFFLTLRMSMKWG
jgi:hypothetical protein